MEISVEEFRPASHHHTEFLGHSNDITIEDIDEVIQRDFKQELLPAEDQSSQSLSDSETPRLVPSSSSASSATMTSNAMQVHLKPAIKIVVQPASKALRFRYECEGRSAGSLPGINSSPENKTFPTIQIINHKGPAVVVVSCVTKDQPFRPHPHKLVGRDGCKKGVSTVQINTETMISTFSNLGIQCVKKKDIDDALREREELRVDPFRTGFDHRNQASNIDLNVVRLCFQAFIEGREKGKFVVPLEPIVSDPIFDKKAMSDLVICKLSACSGPVKGGTEIILLCEKITKDDIEIRFYEERDEKILWQALAEFQPNDVHKQVAITFRTPPYRDQNIQQPVEVQLQLRRRSDGATSEPRSYQYTPLDLDPEWIEKKRRKVASVSLQHFIEQNTNLNPFSRLEGARYPESQQVPMSSESYSQRIFKPAHRRNIKQEPIEQTGIYQHFGTESTVGIGAAAASFYPATTSPSTRMSPNPVPMIMSPSPHAEVLKSAQNPTLADRIDLTSPPNILLLDTVSQSTNYNAFLEKNAFTGNQQTEGLQNSIDLNFSWDSSELNNFLPLSESGYQAIIDNSLHLSSLESALPEPSDSLTNLDNQIMQLNQLGGTSHSQSDMK